ncbi:hypothetical protein CPL00168_CDS0027 [Escherichia phage MatMar]
MLTGYCICMYKAEQIRERENRKITTLIFNHL